MSNSNRDVPDRPSASEAEPGPERRVPGGSEADFGEKGPTVEDDQAGLTEAEKLEEAVEDLSTDRN